MSRVSRWAIITDTTASICFNFMLTVTGFSKFRTSDPSSFPNFADKYRSEPKCKQQSSSSLPIHHVLIGIGSKFSLRIALSVQFPSFQESETAFFCGIHGGFVYVVQLKLKEVKSGCFIHFTIHHKNTL